MRTGDDGEDQDRASERERRRNAETGDTGNDALDVEERVHQSRWVGPVAGVTQSLALECSQSRPHVVLSDMFGSRQPQNLDGMLLNIFCAVMTQSMRLTIDLDSGFLG